jgi:predicted RNA-binding protein YlqC (UPF0109 family)
MIVGFVKKYVKLIVLHTDSIKVVLEEKDNNIKSLCIYVHNDDIGKVIGKNANMISAINTFISVCSIKENVSYKAFVKDIEEYNKYEK